MFENCIFTNNFSVDDGGAVANAGGRPRFINCVFSNNQATRGGAVALYGLLEVSFEGCSFFDNTADEGGALYFLSAGPTRLQGCTLARNEASSGANLSVSESFGDTVIVDRCIVAFGTESEGIYWDGSGGLELSCVDIFGNTGGDWVGAIADQEKINGNLHADPQFCGDFNPLSPFSLASSSPCAPENNPGCGLIGAFPVGCNLPSGTDDRAPVVSGLRLQPCFPNPFNPTTTISFELDSGVDVVLAIYDARGELIRSLASGYFPEGVNRAIWQGENNQGRVVSSGVYFARLTSGDISMVQKMVLLR